MVTRLHHVTSDRELVFDIAQLKDDTEEDLVGSDLHQTAIRTLCDSLWLVGPERGLPWHVSSQLVVLMGKLEGKDWHPSPDIFVHPTAGLEPRTSFDIAIEGVPPFVVEVASPATYEYDIGGKGRGYGYAGVREYLVFDPTAELIGRPVLAWHSTDEGWVSWPSDQDGRWYSRTLDLFLKPEGLLLRVLDAAGVPVPTVREQARQNAELLAELERLRGESRTR